MPTKHFVRLLFYGPRPCSPSRDLRDLRPSVLPTRSPRLRRASIAHAAASERDAGNAAIHHAAMPRPAGERGGGIASANHADAWRPTSQRSQPASFRKNSH